MSRWRTELLHNIGTQRPRHWQMLPQASLSMLALLSLELCDEFVAQEPRPHEAAMRGSSDLGSLSTKEKSERPARMWTGGRADLTDGPSRSEGEGEGNLSPVWVQV